MPDNRKPLKYGAFPVCRNYTVRAYLRDPCLAERNRCKDRIQYAGTQQRRVHPRHLHPRHKQGTGTGGSKDGELAETGALTLKKYKTGWTAKKAVHPVLFLKNFPYGSNLGQENCAVLPTVALSSTSVPDASESAGTLPRPKNSPPDCFCTSVRTGAGLSSPIIHQIPYKNRRYPKISPVFMGWIMGLEPTIFRATI